MASDVLHPADRRPVVGVRRERVLVELLGEEAVDVVVDALAPLVRDHLALGLDLRLVEDEVLHPLGLERRRGPAAPAPAATVAVVGPVDPGRGVGLAADRLEQAVELAGAEVLGLVEHEVLEEVRDAGAAVALVARADAEPGLEGDDRRGVVGQEQHQEAVGEPMFLDGEAGSERVAFDERHGHQRSIPRPSVSWFETRQ